LSLMEEGIGFKEEREIQDLEKENNTIAQKNN
jgi:hypothetical protein